MLSGASKIIAVDLSEQKLEWARRFGATHTINAAEQDPVAAIRGSAHRGADYTFEAVGNLAVIKQALHASAPGVS